MNSDCSSFIYHMSAKDGKPVNFMTVESACEIFSTLP